MQTKVFSLVESITNILVGFGISLVAQILIFEYHDIRFTLLTNIY